VIRDFAEPHRQNHERWLVSYADFITLLFAFFVVMFASSQADRQKVQKASDSVRRAFNGERTVPKMASVLGGTVNNIGQGNRMLRGPGGSEIAPAPVKPVELRSMQQLLGNELADEIGKGKLSLHMETRGLVISLQEAAYFVSGDDQVSAEAYPVLGRIATQLEKVSNPVHLEGHTDSIPIHNARFRTNWELSSSRGIAMLEALSTRLPSSSSRLAVVAYGDAFPVASNETPEGRARNRRVDIVILNQSGMTSLPDSIHDESAKPSPVPPASLQAKP
jgi:chemotaxis protein MotB